MANAVAASRRAAILAVPEWDRPGTDIGLDPMWQTAMSRCFVLDVIETLTASPDVSDIFVATSDRDVAASLAPMNLTLVRGSDHGPQASLAAARDLVVAEGHHDHLLVIARDLPCITVESLADLCERSAVARHTFCTDTVAGYATAILSSDPSGLPIATGRNSSSALRATGAVPIEGVSRRVRRSVRTRQHLFEADRLGVGRHTTATLLELGRWVARAGAVGREEQLAAVGN